MELEPSVLQKLQIAYDIVADVLGQAPQLHDCHLDQALLVLVLSMQASPPFAQTPPASPAWLSGAIPAILNPSSSPLRFSPKPR